MPDRTDHTLIWATHKASGGRARVPRSYLSVNPEWVEEKQHKEPAASAPAKTPKRRTRKKEQK